MQEDRGHAHQFDVQVDPPEDLEEEQPEPNVEVRLHRKQSPQHEEGGIRLPHQDLLPRQIKREDDLLVFSECLNVV